MLRNICIALYVACVLLILGTQPCLGQQRRKVKVPQKIIQQLMRNDEDVQAENYTADQLAHELRAETIDLNNDGKPELIVQGFCAAVGNCSTWIYRTKEGGYLQLLNDMAQVIKVRRTITNGYRDLVFETHGSATDSGIMVYKFDGTQYRLKECFERTYRYEDRRGRMRDWKRPRITGGKCEPEQ